MPRCWCPRFLFGHDHCVRFGILRRERSKSRHLRAGLFSTVRTDASSKRVAAVARFPAAARVEEQGEDEERDDGEGETHGGRRLLILGYECAPRLRLRLWCLSGDVQM